MNVRNVEDDVIDLESSTQIELGRQPVRDVDSYLIDSAEAPAIREPFHQRAASSANREFGLSQFPDAM